MDANRWSKLQGRGMDTQIVATSTTRRPRSVVDFFGFSFQKESDLSLQPLQVVRVFHFIWFTSLQQYQTSYSVTFYEKLFHWFVPSSVGAAFLFCLIDWFFADTSILYGSCFPQTFQEVPKRICWLYCITKIKVLQKLSVAPSIG